MAAWACEHCLVSAGLWRTLAKEIEAREMATQAAEWIRGRPPHSGEAGGDFPDKTARFFNVDFENNGKLRLSF